MLFAMPLFRIEAVRLGLFMARRPSHPRWLLLLLLVASLTSATAQTTGVILGTVRDKRSQEPLVGVTILADGTTPTDRPNGTTTDADGRYRLVLPTGTYALKATLVGYQPLTKFNVVLSSGNAPQITFELDEASTDLQEVVVKYNRSVQVASIETPNSVQRLTAEEIKANPGSNGDISRVLQTLPGVAAAGAGGFRNDLNIRGGASGENVCYLDGIEIPTINHFSTQGATGGPQGLINPIFIDEATLSSSAFNARYDNPLSAVLQLRQREGNPERLQTNLRLSGSEFGATLEGPLSAKTTFLSSVRRSYLQYFFTLIDLNIRPAYWDFQYKITHRFSKKTTLTTLGIGSIDDFGFAQVRQPTEQTEYELLNNPIIKQTTYTVGLALKRLLPNGFTELTASRSVFNNRLDRFENARNGDEAYRTLKSVSQEAENKLRLTVNQNAGPWEFSYGGMAQLVHYDNDFLAKLTSDVLDGQGKLVRPGLKINFNTVINFAKYGAFGQVSRRFLDERLNLSLGLRTDMNSFTTNGNDPLRTLSPRLSASWQLADRWRLNASLGRYYKIPSYTVLGFRNENGRLVNRSAHYIRSDHAVAGLEYIPSPSLRITLEGFYKQYADYPVSVRDGVSLANQGNIFGAIGNEAVASVGRGRAYGLEAFVQQKFTRKLFFVLALTLFKSEFTGADGQYRPSAWDSRYIFSGQLGRKFPRGWEMGLKLVFQGGLPNTPFDLTASRQNFLATGAGVLDYSRLNTERLGSYKRFDFRMDKKWSRRKVSFDAYFDVQNAFVFGVPGSPQYTFQHTTDLTTFDTTDKLPVAADGSNAKPLILPNDSPVVLPTIGFVVEF